jgi:hypothetical protein
MSQHDNLALWHAVEKTDPSQTKAITGKPYKGTSPKPYYLVHKATETFGPAGIGWGFQIVSERVEDGTAGDKVHIAHVRVWYIWNEKKGEVEHVGQTMLAGKNKNGPFTDEDAPKKSVTDALVKALSMIGFAGDIFMGRYDDSAYLNGLRQEERERAEGYGNEPITKAETEHLVHLLQEAQGDPERFCRYMNVPSIAAIPASQFDRAVAAIATVKKKKQNGGAHA